MMRLDEKDVVIMQALDEFSFKITKQELEVKLTDILKISDRAIRYRIFKLKEKGLIKQTVITTHERKLGLGDYLILLKINHEMEDKLQKLLKLIPYVYLCSSTYGKFDGYLIRFIYSLKKPDSPLKMLDTMKKAGYIIDFYTLDVVDYRLKNYDFTCYKPNQGWVWDCNSWYTQIKNSFNSPRIKFNPTFDLAPKLAKFDYKDIRLLQLMLKDASITQTKLKEELSISESQISKRIQILKEKGIIRGYFIDFDLMKSEDFIEFYFFLDISEPFDLILSLFYQIPYPVMILVESPSRFCITMKLGAKDFNSFLKGFDLLKSHLNSYFFQLTHHQAKENPQYVFELFNKVTSQWETPIDDYISLL